MKRHVGKIGIVLALIVAVVACPAAVRAEAQFDALRKKFIDGEKSTGTIAYFELKGLLAETPTEMPPLFGSEPPASMLGMLRRLKEARIDPSVVAVVVDLQQSMLGLAQIEELHDALRKFSAVDKPVYVHADTLTTLSYSVATGASHISIVPTGDLWLLGLHGEAPYLRGALDKLGCVPDFETCGNFKTASEPLTRKGPSEQQQEMTNWMLDSLYAGMVDRIADGRKMTSAKVRDLIDQGPFSAEEAKELGLIDAVQHRQDFVAGLKDRYGDGVKIDSSYAEDDPLDIPDDNIFAMFEFMMKLFNPQEKVYTEPSVAIVYVEGTILTGEAEKSPFGAAEGAFSTSIRRALDKAAKDDTVKAVVLRIDSPGGSALASEIILDATRRVAEKKPLIVSMGNVAASGGYYVTCASETIFADPMTITASIGVLGGKIVTTEMWDKLGINWHANQRGKHAALMSTGSKWNDSERAEIRKYMENVYEIFKGHVVSSRMGKLSKPIDEIAGGRVFTGRQALELGLVDRLGGLSDAVLYAAERANMGDYDIRVIPEPPTIFDMFAPPREKQIFANAGGTSLAFASTAPFSTMLPTIAAVDPIRFRAVLTALQRIELIRQETVIAMTPFDLVIR